MTIVLGAPAPTIRLDSLGRVVSVFLGDAEIPIRGDLWSIRIDGIDHTSDELELVEHSSTGSTARFTLRGGGVNFVVEYRGFRTQGVDHALRTVSARATGGRFVVEEFRAQLDVEGALERSELRTFSEAPFAARIRTESSAILTGLQNPQVETAVDDGLTFSYRPGQVVEGRFTASGQFFGAARLTGEELRPKPPRSRISYDEPRPRGRFRNPSGTVPLDIEEIRVLRAVVRQYLEPLDPGAHSILYTYWTPLPQLPSTPDDERAWREALDNFVDLGGDLVLTVPLVRADPPTRDSDSYWQLEPPGSAADRILSHARSRGLRIGYYLGVAAGNLPYGNAPGLGLPLDGPNRWRKRGPDGSVARENCLAMADYRDWLTTVTRNTIRRYDLAAWSWDPGPGDGRDCYADDHGHLPGEGAHLGWLQGQEFVRSLHESFPGLHLQGFYGQKQDGTWGLKGISQHEGYWEQQVEWGAALYPDLSPERVTGHGTRQQAWWSQNFRFLPAEQNHALSGRMTATCTEAPALGTAFDTWGWRYGLLSAIAVGGSVQLATLPPRDLPEPIRGQYRDWLSWAREHPGPWDLDHAGGDQVEIGGADWYLRVRGDRVWVFVGNPGPRPVRARLQLPPGTPSLVGRRLRLLTPEPADLLPTADGDDRITAEAQFSVLVPPLTVLPLELEREGDGAAAALPPADQPIVIPLEHWTGAPNPLGSGTIATEIDLAAVAPAGVSRGAEYRRQFPDFPDVFADVDPDRTILVVPIDHLQPDELVTARVDGETVPVGRMEYRAGQLARFGMSEQEYHLWPTAPVVSWVDLSDFHGRSPVRIELTLPPLADGRFLGPYLQAPPRVVVSSRGEASLPPLSVADLPAPGNPVAPPVIHRAWLDPARLRADSRYEITVVADADAVFASLPVGSGSAYDRRLHRVGADRWSISAAIGDRTGVILDPPAIAVWATRGDQETTVHLPCEWELPPHPTAEEPTP